MQIIKGKNKIENVCKAEKEDTTIFQFVGDKGIFPYSKTCLTGCSPFAIIASGMFLLSGRSDKNWIGQFSNKVADKKESPFYQFSLGERIRFWGRSNLENFIFNPQDQLVHAYEQITMYSNCNPTIQLFNPQFDNNFDVGFNFINANYIPCTITFKWNNKCLSMFVHFKKLLDTELVQNYLFPLSMIHHLLASWLKNTKELKIDKDENIVGDLIIYADDYIPRYIINSSEISNISFSDPEITFSFDQALSFVDVYFSSLDNLFKKPELAASSYKNVIQTMSTINDDFFHDMVLSMCSSRLIDNYVKTLDQKDLDKVFDTLAEFRSNWNIPLYAMLTTDKRLIIPAHIEHEMKHINKIKDLIALFKG